MINPFRKHHLLCCLREFEQSMAPLDLFLQQYLRENRAIGAHDRRVIVETLYGMIRWKGLLAAHIAPKNSWESMIDAYLGSTIEELSENKSLPSHVRASFPEELYQLLVEDLGEEGALQFCLTSNHQAPTTIRVNSLKITREELFDKLALRFPISLCPTSKQGIIFQDRVNFSSLPEFKEGLFDVQDEGSQLIADYVNACKGAEVLDFCAGAGGKSLAIAPQLEGKGQLYLHDIRTSALSRAKERLRRAGVQNSQIVLPDSSPLRRLKKRMDYVLVDLPCSGTGTLRRNPDQKWKFSSAMLNRLVEEQRAIFATALTYLHPKGTIIYATCSALSKENDQQIAYLQQTHALHLVKEPFRSLPLPGGMDGFFAAALAFSPVLC